jgi:flagellar basal-body rod protein FlgC
MDIGRTFAISASGLHAERTRLDVIASNLANANATETPEGGPYKRRSVVFVTAPLEDAFGAAIEAAAEEGALRGVEVAAIVEDQKPPRLVFDPGHPDANAEGYVAYPNINMVGEMVDLLTATRAYEANVQAINAAKRMSEAALNIGTSA